MTESLAHDDVREPSFTVYAEEPSLLHLSGELDLTGGPELATALEPLTRRGARSRSMSPTSPSWTRPASTSSARLLVTSAIGDASSCSTRHRRCAASSRSRGSPNTSPSTATPRPPTPPADEHGVLPATAGCTAPDHRPIFGAVPSGEDLTASVRWRAWRRGTRVGLGRRGTGGGALSRAAAS
jgi:hypothetical protein